MSHQKICLLHLTTSQHVHENTRDQFQEFTGRKLSVGTKAPKIHEDQIHTQNDTHIMQ
jgi:hypothetical protein